MYRPRVIPVLLLGQRGLVKTIGFAQPSYVGDPMNAVRIFNDAEADELVVLDIDATREGRIPPPDQVRQIADEAFMPFAIGGGVRNVADVAVLLALGAERVVINTAAFEVPGLVRSIADEFGSSAVIVSIDARRLPDGTYGSYVRAGTRSTGLPPGELARRAAGDGAGEILLSSIDRDGTRTGFDLDLVREVTAAVSLPVIACGGAGSYPDLRAPIVEAGATAVAAGSLFVHIGTRRAVLIHYPDQAEIAELLGDSAADTDPAPQTRE